VRYLPIESEPEIAVAEANDELWPPLHGARSNNGELPVNGPDAVGAYSFYILPLIT
jgi:hypothetical protein